MQAVQAQPAHSPEPHTMALVEEAIASGVGGLTFDRELERRYEADTQRQRLQFLTSTGICGAVIYNLFLISDWLALEDVFAYVAVGRLLLITPMIIAILLLAQRLTSRRALETVSALATVLSSLMPLVVMIYSDSPYRLHYQLGMLLLMVYCTMIQQLPFRFAVAAMASMLGIQLLTTHIAGFMDPVTWRANAFLYGSTVVLLLMASYFLERASRLSYLFALRGRLLEVQLTEMARTDPLTQLFNRRHQGDVTAQLWQAAGTEATCVTAILIDIDHFKLYNDSYGHLQGDSCLKQVSATIKELSRQSNAMPFRFGGEEMLVLLVGADSQQARQLGQDLCTAVADLGLAHPALGAGARVTISVGIAMGIAPYVTAHNLIGAADKALYAAKNAGRNCLRQAPFEGSAAA
ncbi:GGDEF domain-containing protein [Pseudomonas sp. CFBP 13727]|uniref:GGDEF domain-containing protein n=1 Tax=Pseudomonas sp. CFBP 13727 TaxID=2775295 RepID=UPI00177B5E82|nr:GGDEF domain-containing protein [Pseudomonas sp. CFBP 13727]MBD8624997.1 GGDEF domain-containing protein [Pseudomonas sp. CFBP 13727]